MKNECSIVQDLLPLYAEDMLSADTKDFVEEHMKACEKCRKECESINDAALMGEMPDAAPLKKLGRKMKIKKIQTVALTAAFLAALFLSAFAVLDAPIYFPYSKSIVAAEEWEGEGMLLTFDEKVTDFDYTVYKDPDGGNFSYCEVKAWTSLFDMWFSGKKGRLSVVIKEKPVLAVYVPNDGGETAQIAKYDAKGIDKNAQYQSTVVLPRLSLGYAVIAMAAAAVFLGIMWCVFRKKTRLRIWIERIGLYPIAYIISHFIVAGINWETYSLMRDFSFILFISVLLYGGMLLMHNVLYLKREIAQINNR